MRWKKLHLYTVSGHTFSFSDVEIVSINEVAITFTFTAMSDGLGKTGNFFFRHIAGYTWMLADGGTTEETGSVTGA